MTQAKILESRWLYTFFLIGILFNAVMLWFTRDVTLESESAYAISNNVGWYNAMHTFAIIFFVMWAMKIKKIMPFLVGLGMASILITNMYHYRTAHDIATGLTLGLASWYIIMGSSVRNRPYNILLIVIAIAAFLFAYLTHHMRLFWGEVIAEAMIAVGMARRIWIKPDA